MRIVFLGTPADAVPALKGLAAAGHEVALVITQPDRRRGRAGRGLAGALHPSPVKVAATELGLEVLEPVAVDAALDKVRRSGAELGVVVAFGQLIPAAVLEVPPDGFVNLHFSLLPRWRGAAPVERAILAGDEVTGVCLMRLEAGLDTGPVFAREELAIGAEETAGELRGRLVVAGTRMLLSSLGSIPVSEPVPQDGKPTYAAKLTVAEFRLDWSRPAGDLVRLVRAGNPRPGAWTHVGGRRLKILRARASIDTGPIDAAPGGDRSAPGVMIDDGGPAVWTGQGLLILERVQPEGRGEMDGRAWAAGLRDRPLLLGQNLPSGDSEVLGGVPGGTDSN